MLYCRLTLLRAFIPTTVSLMGHHMRPWHRGIVASRRVCDSMKKRGDNSLLFVLYYCSFFAHIVRSETLRAHTTIHFKGANQESQCGVESNGEVTKNHRVNTTKISTMAHCRYCNDQFTFGSLRNHECSDGLNFHEPDVILKDNDLLTKIRINPHESEKLYDQLEQDVSV